MLIKKQLVLFAMLIATIGCDSYPIDIHVKQSIKNMSSDTIIIINSLKEFKRIDIDTIVCLPTTETFFFDDILTKQPLEPYNIPLINEGSVIYISSGRKLVKDIYNERNWDFIQDKKQQWLSFTITEDDLE